MKKLLGQVVSERTKTIKAATIVVFSFLVFGNFALADIHDDINQCEASGGGACVFDLFRKLVDEGSSDRVAVKLYSNESDCRRQHLVVSRSLLKDMPDSYYTDQCRAILEQFYKIKHYDPAKSVKIGGRCRHVYWLFPDDARECGSILGQVINP